MGSPLFALPFWVLGGYLIWRVFKYQKVLTARSGSARGAARGTPEAHAAVTACPEPGRRAEHRVPANPRAAGRAGAAAARERAQSSRTPRSQGTGPHRPDARRSATRHLGRRDPARRLRRPEAP